MGQRQRFRVWRGGGEVLLICIINPCHAPIVEMNVGCCCLSRRTVGQAPPYVKLFKNLRRAGLTPNQITVWHGTTTLDVVEQGYLPFEVIDDIAARVTGALGGRQPVIVTR